MLDWIDRQDDWMRDALRRHAGSSNYVLSEADREAVLDRVHQAANVQLETKSQALKNVPITEADLKSGVELGETNLLCSLGPVANVARLAPDQQLSFAANGITLIYGENGSGKSGYCRITKKVCRSLSTDELIGDVFQEGTKPPAQVLIRLIPKNAPEGTPPTEINWKDEDPPPAAIRRISVFDAKNAQLYTSQNNRIEYVPSEVALLESHAAFREELSRSFAADTQEIQKRVKVALPTGYTKTSSASQLIERLTPNSANLPTVEEVRDAGRWDDSDQKELDELARKLAESPAARLGHAKRWASVIQRVRASLKACDENLGDARATKFKAAVEALAVARAAQASVASEKLSAEPLQGVGSDQWRAMYEYAERFVQTLGLEGIETNEGTPCPLCQEPLSKEASDRMERFHSYMTDEAAKARRIAEEGVQSLLDEAESVQIPTADEISAQLDEFADSFDSGGTVLESVQTFMESAALRQTWFVAAASEGDSAEPNPLANDPSEHLDAEKDAVDALITELEDQAAADAARDIAQARLIELGDRYRLYNDMDTVVARAQDLHDLAQLQRCSAIVSNRALSTQITTVRRGLLATGLHKRIQAEIEELDLSHIPFKISDQSRGGQSLFGVGVKSAVSIGNDKVLSEGEQRALALACFLGEQPEQSDHGLVIDDPVSSLDHTRLRRVAQRLVKEAQSGKQVIVFTHNLLFYNEVSDCAAMEQVPLAKRVITKSHSKGFGVISDSDEPWMVVKVADRIKLLNDRLEEFDGVTDFETDDYRRRAKDFYSDLRETWERLVEELLLGKVVQRMSSGVMTQSLKQVEVTDEDHQTVFWNMSRVSEYSGHDQSAGKNAAAPPTPNDMKADLEKIREYRSKIRKRNTETEQRRKETVEKAPDAKVH